MLGKLFDRQASSRDSSNGPSGPRIPRHSGAWGALRKRLVSESGLRVLDIGSTSPTNINFLTNLGHSVYMADLIEDAYSGEWMTGLDEEGKEVWNAEDFTTQNLQFSGKTFDIVLLWTVLDYLPEALVAPIANALHKAMDPGGQLMALFHTKLLPEQSHYHRFHLTETDEIDCQMAKGPVQQRAFTNRNIERLFSNWSGLKQFLAKDGVSEAIIVR